MLLQSILALLLIRHLHKHLKTREPLLFPKWQTHLKFGTVISILLIVLSLFKSDSSNIIWVLSKNIISALSDLWVLAIIILIHKQKDFSFAKPISYAVLPVVIVHSLQDIIILFSPAIIKKWDNYFNTAEVFAFIWLVAMLINNNKQRKALEKERSKTEEKEKEFRITEKLKAELEIQVRDRTAALTLQKQELEHSLQELKTTQNQLIQSEKMASLGELTAGIAHEIQNPLNFVNNFSEVSTELVDEMNEEINKGNLDNAKDIANDLKQNLEKINHHGKRAGDIVKGMLQHSRSSTGIKEPTDINALADEYLRLAYHGLRAKDKTFNATMKTEYDESLSADKGQINIIPQDMGRVILNLITNAFYAVDEKKKQNNPLIPVRRTPLEKGETSSSINEAYEPIVTVTTRRLSPPVGGRGAEVLISVKDNGNGIPQNILDKIFQPFFTTKPTGKGTGLGLSMSYDIVTKGHGGDLSVKTVEGEGSEFTIKLPI